MLTPGRSTAALAERVDAREEISPVNVQETREANGKSILVHVQLKW
jgi:hypothetical protein